MGGIERGETGKKKSEVEVRKGRERERERKWTKRSGDDGARRDGG